MKESDLPEYLDNLVKSSNQVLRLLETALDDCIIPLWSLKCGDDMRINRFLQQLMHQIVLSFHTCFKALNELCLTILGRSMKHEIVYRLAMFFKKALDHLHTVCTLQAKTETEGRRKTRSQRDKIGEEYAVNKYLPRALILISQVDWQVGKPGHSDILEGILFAILEHTGRLVSNAVFNEHIAISDKVGNITLGDTEPWTGAAPLEARYIVPVLHAALGRSNSRRELVDRVLYDGCETAKVQTQGSSQQTLTDSGCDLLLKARKRLQETLVKCAIGGEGLGGLVLPSQPDDFDISPEPAQCAEKYSPEWLIESIWADVGWELAIPSK